MRSIIFITALVVSACSADSRDPLLRAADEAAAQNGLGKVQSGRIVQGLRERAVCGVSDHGPFIYRENSGVLIAQRSYSGEQWAALQKNWCEP